MLTSALPESKAEPTKHDHTLVQPGISSHESNPSSRPMQALLPRSSSAEWAAAPMEAIRLIDYEYAGLNAVAYDIANHWSEPCADCLHSVTCFNAFYTKRMTHHHWV